MVACYDLCDMHAVFLNIRAYPVNPINEKGFFCLIDIIKNRSEISEINQIRSAIAPFLSLDGTELYSFAGIQNTYTYFPAFIKDEKVFQSLLYACEELMSLINKQNNTQIQALADCLHNLPILILEYCGKIPRKF